jgi:RNA-directed DNA polymerase
MEVIVERPAALDVHKAQVTACVRVPGSGRERVQEVAQFQANRFLRGWAGYFRYGNSARHFLRMMTYAITRLALLMTKRHRRTRSYGWWAVVHRSSDRLGLINLNGSVVAPRPQRSRRG